MASISIYVKQQFDPGTLLGVYPDVGGSEPPSGSPLTTATVDANALVTFAGLNVGIGYVAGAVVSGKWRGVAFLIPATPTMPVVSGPAGGVLAGEFPNPGFAMDMATQAELDAAIAAETASRAAGDAGVGAPNVQTGNYTLAAADAGKTVEMNAAGATIVTVPTNAAVAFAIGTIIEVARLGAGSVTIHPAGGVLIRNHVDTGGTVDRTIASQYNSVSLRKRATDEWVLVGDLG